MIAYDLRCTSAHEFEGWFGSSRDFDAQNTSGLLRCPICDDGGITKRLTAPHIGRKSNQAAQISAPVSGEAGESSAALESSPPQLANVPASEAMSEMITKLAKLQNEVLKDSRWVGRKFADEARAMHYGETQPQQIHGESSPQEADALAAEGIAIAALPLPVIPPEAKN